MGYHGCALMCTLDPNESLSATLHVAIRPRPMAVLFLNSVCVVGCCGRAHLVVDGGVEGGVHDDHAVGGRQRQAQPANLQP